MAQVTRPDGSVIRYEIAGEALQSSLPVLLLAPGGVDSAIERWDEASFRPAWLSGYRMISVDQRFAGQSNTHFCAFSHQSAVEDLLAVLDDCDEHNVTVVGEGMGALQAMRLAYEAPARIAGIVAIAPFRRQASMDHVYEAFNPTIRLARAEGLQAVMAAAQKGGTFASNPDAGPWISRLSSDEGYRAAITRLGRETYITHVVDFRDGLYPWEDTYFALSDVAVGRIRVPTAIVPGEDADAAVDLCARTLGQTVDLSPEAIRDFLNARQQPA